MIQKEKITSLVNDAIKGTDMFITGIQIRPGNSIIVYLDGDKGVTIDDCVMVSRYVEAGLNRDDEDFELTVSSHGLTSPLLMPRQYMNHVGREISVVMADGMKYSGLIESASQDSFILNPVGKSKQTAEPMIIQYNAIKQAKLNISFKE